MTFAQLTEKLTNVSAKLEGRDANIFFDLSGSDACMTLVDCLDYMQIGDEILFNLDFDDFFGLDDEFDSETDPDEFWEIVDITSCNCFISLNTDNLNVFASLDVSGTVKGSPFSVEDIQVKDVEFSPEDAARLIARTFNAEQIKALKEMKAADAARAKAEKDALEEAARAAAAKIITADTFERELKTIFLNDSFKCYVNTLAASINGDSLKRTGAILYEMFRFDGEIKLKPLGISKYEYEYTRVSPINYALFDRIYDFCMSIPRLHDDCFAGTENLIMKKNDDSRYILFPAFAVKGTKPCAYEPTKLFTYMMELLSAELDKYGIKAGVPYFHTEETYWLKKSNEKQICRNSYKGTCCSGCTNKTGLFSNYSNSHCLQSIYVNFSKK